MGLSPRPAHPVVLRGRHARAQAGAPVAQRARRVVDRTARTQDLLDALGVEGAGGARRVRPLRAAPQRDGAHRGHMKDSAFTSWAVGPAELPKPHTNAKALWRDAKARLAQGVATPSA